MNRSFTPAVKRNQAVAQQPELVLQPTHGWATLNLRDVWEHRELLWFLAWRDIKVRYKQTLIGAAWAMLKPIMSMLVFSLIFGTLIGVDSGVVPYPVFVYSGLLTWNLFASALGQSGSSLVSNASLISKVYFPRLVLPIASVVVALLDFLVALLVLVVLMLAYGIVPGPTVLILPLFVALALATALGVGLWLSALEIKYRDVGHTVPFLTQFWLFITPVIYPSSVIPAQWRWLYSLNPMVGVVEGFRWSLLGNGRAPGVSLILSVAVMLVVLVSGLVFFKRSERQFADVV